MISKEVLAGVLFGSFILLGLGLIQLYLLLSWFFVLRGRNHPMIMRGTRIVASLFIGGITIATIFATRSFIQLSQSWLIGLTILAGGIIYAIILPIGVIQLLDPTALMEVSPRRSTWTTPGNLLARFRFRPGTRSAAIMRIFGIIVAVPFIILIFTTILLFISGQ